MNRGHAFGYAVMAIAIVGSVWFVLWLQGVREQECYDRGGVALVSLRDNICIDAEGRVIRP